MKQVRLAVFFEDLLLLLDVGGALQEKLVCYWQAGTGLELKLFDLLVPCWLSIVISFIRCFGLFNWVLVRLLILFFAILSILFHCLRDRLEHVKIDLCHTSGRLHLSFLGLHRRKQDYISSIGVGDVHLFENLVCQ